MLSLLCVVLAHRASETANLKADLSEQAIVDENTVLGKFEALKAQIPGVVSHAMKTMQDAFTGEKHAMEQATAETGHKFSFLLDGAQMKSASEAMAAMKALHKDSDAIEHDVGVTIESLEHHFQQSPSSFLQGNGLTEDDIQKHWDKFKEEDRKVASHIQSLDLAVKQGEISTGKVLADLHRTHEKYLQEVRDREEDQRSAARKAGIAHDPSSFVEAPGDARRKKEEAEFKAEFKKMDDQLKKDLGAMKTHKKRSTSLLQTDPAEPTYADLSAKAEALQRQMQEDVDNLNPDTPDLTGPDAGQQASTWEDEAMPPPMSLLQRGPAEDLASYQRRMVAMGSQTSWAQLRQNAERTLKAATEDEQDFHASSFAEIGAEGQISAAQQQMADRRATLQQIAALQKKTQGEVHDTTTEIGRFTRETEREIAELKVPHTTIAEALERARQRASSFLETAAVTSASDLNAVDAITVQSQFDQLQALHAKTQAKEAQKLQEAIKFGQGLTEKASLLEDGQASGAAAQKQAAEAKLQHILSDLHTELDGLHGEVGGPSSFIETGSDAGSDNFDQLEARLKKLQGSVSSHLEELQERAGGAVASSFAEIHADINMAVARAAARQKTLEAARELREARGEPTQEFETIDAEGHKHVNMTAQYLNFQQWHQHMRHEIDAARKANAMSAKIFGPLTSSHLAELKHKAESVETKLFGERETYKINHSDEPTGQGDGDASGSLLQTASIPYSEQEDASLNRQAALNQEPTDQPMKAALDSLESFEGKIGKFPETFGKEFKKEVLDKLHAD